jgi:excisionase family DNA binding protein
MRQISEYPDVLTKSDVAELLQVSKRSLDYWVAAREIPHKRIGPRSVRFRKDTILEWLEEGEAA